MRWRSTAGANLNEGRKMKQVRNLIAAWTVAAGFALLFTGCASTDPGLAGSSSSRTFAADHPRAVPLLPPVGSGKGAYYKDDGPGANPPPRLDMVPDAVFKPEPLAKIGNRRYSVFGATYTPLPGEASYSQRGVASWYGRKFHGHRTASGERYDMYKMTAAHPTLPIPSYVRVTNPDTGKHVTVRINDRGPFLGGRLIDVSYTAALKLGILQKGSQHVQVDRILASDSGRVAALPAQVDDQEVAAPDEIAMLMLEDRLPDPSRISGGAGPLVLTSSATGRFLP
jgi:rare lipoprotein A